MIQRDMAQYTAYIPTLLSCVLTTIAEYTMQEIHLRIRFFLFFFFISTMYPSNSSTMYTNKRNCGAVGAVLPLPLPLPVVIATSTINRIS